MTFQEALSYLKNTSPLRITVSGEIGAGKSTFSKRLAAELDIPRVYVGQFMREEAAKRGMTLDAFNKLLETDDAIDKQMDEMQKTRSQTIDRGVFEGRTAWFFVENPDVKIFLDVDPTVSAERIWKDENDLRDTYASFEELMKANQQRKENEILRYQNHYGIDAYDHQNFDIILDTTTQSKDEVFEHAIVKAATFLKKQHQPLDKDA